ncbi:hypothetical protein F8388_001831 [Cannabis sativa]|uniref:Uncharacterized protein n=1 Tax=Cannabis sativa TaxID=3483 RepID=A0A7J6F068_CANSA|nr:hypothetical protein F8388_001831 [Cannabis sativa]
MEPSAKEKIKIQTSTAPSKPSTTPSRRTLGPCQSHHESPPATADGAILPPHNRTSRSCTRSEYKKVLFFVSLYVLSVGEGGHKPCVQTFAADQFEEKTAEEKKAKSSFFNWWYLGIVAGATVAIILVIYIQDTFVIVQHSAPTKPVLYFTGATNILYTFGGHAVTV